MPVYTYRCANCGTELDQHQSFNAPPLTHCPTCHEEQMQRVYKPIRIVFKGSGFYATDHRSPSGTNKANNGQAGKNSESDGKSAESEKSDSKSPAPAPETVS
jgi:putative FmdB family regulatory protein